MAGIDTTKFSARSCRSASTSAAFDRDVPLDNTLLDGPTKKPLANLTVGRCWPHIPRLLRVLLNLFSTSLLAKNVKVTMLGDYVVICKFVVHMFPDAKVSCKYV